MNLNPSRFERLGEAFFTRLHPSPLPSPHWVGVSPGAASLLELPDDALEQPGVLEALSGNALLPGSSPLASVYSGHQFGHWAGQLGDGRAITLGDRATASGPMEIQLKGCGLTPYSRMGDGRAVLRSSIREFLCSEAMHALQIPTTRALCVTGSPQAVRREEYETAAVVTRVAPSFVRFGHFEHFSHSGQHTELRALADFVIEHFFPACHHHTSDTDKYLCLLEQVTLSTAELIAQWQAVGFCHGVMNTDNMSILGLTLDYGPFQFMDAFNPSHICNHTDRGGRYAYARQPNMAYWNLFCLGQALLVLTQDSEATVARIETFREAFPRALGQRMNAKLGLTQQQPQDHVLTEGILQLMTADQVDYTLFWRRLSHAAMEGDLTPVRDLFQQKEDFDQWAQTWRTRLQNEPLQASVRERMLACNPAIVLRNHLAQIAIHRAQQGDLTYLQRLQNALSRPFEELPDHTDLYDLPPEWAQGIAISCSS